MGLVVWSGVGLSGCSRESLECWVRPQISGSFLVKIPRRPRPLVILGIAALSVVLIGVGVAVAIGRRAATGEPNAPREGESPRLAGAAEAAETLRKIAERNRESARACLQYADAESAAFAQQLWRERADEFRREADRVSHEADKLAMLARGRTGKVTTD